MPKISAESVAAHRRQTAERILDTVEALLQENVSPITMGTVAQRLHMGRSSLYRYHDNIDSMIEAVVVRDFPRRTEHIAAAMAAAPTPREAIHAYAVASFHEARASRHSWRASLSRVHLQPEARARIGRLHAELTHRLRDEVERLEIESPEIRVQLVNSIQALINAGVQHVTRESAAGHDGGHRGGGRVSQSAAQVGGHLGSDGSRRGAAQAGGPAATADATAILSDEPLRPANPVEEWYVRAVDAVIDAALVPADVSA